MEKFEEIMRNMQRISPEEREKILEEEGRKCICGECPVYNACAKNAHEGFFCAWGKSFVCITSEEEEKCICPDCPVMADWGMKHIYHCTRGEERAQWFDQQIRK
ncbi:hypothetical protein ABH15_07710 [Methanoculleus taiwanensis]|uniref:DUF2769 domain-containing protein n=2 Tax=Methanoculleus taiwanensis TaxID=1550565 RepID=A0A498H147_9EURY|nr:hypothetical protein ABH15_07710 [Methanoculleus taiwanensis]